MSVAITREDAVALDDVMIVMRCAFDPSYGEGWTASQCAGVLAMPGADLLLARDATPNATPVGFALLRTVVGETEVMLIAVAPEARNQGVATLLLAGSMTHARARGAKRLFLEVRADNSALSFYRASGLSAVGRRPDYYRGNDGQLRDALTLARDL